MKSAQKNHESVGTLPPPPSKVTPLVPNTGIGNNLLISFAGDGTITRAGPEVAKTFGVHEHRLAGSNVDAVLPGLQKRVARFFSGKGARPARLLLKLARKQESPLTIGVTRDSERSGRADQDRYDVLLLASHSDSDQARMELYVEALRRVADGVIIADSSGLIIYVNPAAEILTGWRLRRALGRAIADVICIGEGERSPGLAQLVNQAHCSGSARREALLQRRDGGSRQVSIALVAAKNSQTGDGTVITLTDLSSVNGLKQRLCYQSSHDALTGLLNRSAFEQEIKVSLDEVRLDGTVEHAVLYLDLDQFKVINDTCGHACGDRLLVQIAQSLAERVRGSDVLARLGGDEFGVLLRGCSMAAAVSVAQDLRALVGAHRFYWQGRMHQHSVSIGVASVSRRVTDVATILSAADVACFTAKDRGRDRVQVYREETVPERHVEMQWVSRVARAMDEGRIIVYQQPIVPLLSDGVEKEPRHHELLLRMTDRFGQIIMPGQFIAAAERYNLMPRMDRWIVREALDKFVCIDRAEYMISINLSGTSLSDESFLEFVLEELDRRSIPQGALCFEITETAAISNIANVADFMHEVRAKGGLFSLDDFGSGLSSFTYLKEMPVDYLKIDGHFVRDLCTDSQNIAVLDAINRVGHALGIKTVAERVETREVAERLAALGVDYAQGYFFAKPKRVSGRGGFAAPSKGLSPD